MQNIHVEVSESLNGVATVVSNDTPVQAQPAIKLEGLNFPVNFSTGSNAANNPLLQLKSLEAQRCSWEKTELAASNKRLYAILTDAFAFYLKMKLDPIKETRAEYLADLNQFIAERGYTFMPSSHDMTRVVKCVFGVDRRRVSAYSIALREALRQQVTASELVAFIEENGGVEQIRLGGTKPLSAKIRAEKVKDLIANADLGHIKFDPATFCADADWADKQVVIVATYLPTGEYQANAVIRHDAAVNAALAAYYSQQQAKQREIARAARDAEKETEAIFKKAEALRKKNKPAPTKEEKLEKQKAKVAAKVAESARLAANKVHAATLFSDVSA